MDGLVEDGVLEDERKGNLRFFKLNKNYPLYNELKSIISKTIGLQYRLHELVNIFPDIECAFIFGSMAKNQEVTDSDIDLMIIGNPDANLFTEKTVALERELNREINYHIFDKGEINKKLVEKDSFFMNVFNNEMIILKGNFNDYANLIGH
ncbi:MAG: nucleotidyltransferase domain-containing protein [Candidatus Buchananbacteria bacterium]